MHWLYYLGAWCLCLSAYLHQQIVCRQLTLVSAQKTCICPGDVVIYKCTVMGGLFGGSTVFRGKSSPFVSCTGESINKEGLLILPHSLFNQSQGVKRTCNNGTIIGRSLSVKNGTYSSQLSITVTSELIGDTIECAQDNGTHIYEVGMAIINYTGPFFLSNDKIYISKVGFHSSRLTFHWNPATTDCSIVHYNINTSNCGNCPTTTNHTTVACTDVPTNGICKFSVWTVVCENVITYQNGILNVTLDSKTGCSGLAASTGFLAISLSGCVVVFSTVIITLLKRKRTKTLEPVTSDVGVTSRVRSQSPVYDEMVSVHSSSRVAIDTKQNIAYSSALKH